jgi:hypothetical protein
MKASVLAGIVLGSIVSVAAAQTPTTSRAARGEGLEGYSDDALMNELATRGLDSLLDRAFEVNNVPEAQRSARRSMLALSRLSDPNARISAAERQQIITDVVKGIDAALPSMNDPNLLMRQAFVLITQAIEPEINTLEYWGTNPRTQGAVRPIVETAMRLLERCATLAREQGEALANRITSPNSPQIARFEELERLQATAEYTRNMVAYDLALALDAASPRRRQVASDALEYLQQFNVPENPDRAIVRNRMAKLAMVLGDYDNARRLFASVVTDTAQPRPTVAQFYEAQYFTAVTELLARNADAAQAGLNELLSWQQSFLPRDEQTRKGAEAAAAMLQYRIHALRAQLAVNPQEKQQSDDAAVAVLMQLLAQRPDLRSTIYDQLLPKIGEQTDLKTVEPLLLRALVSKGEQEIQRPASQQVDQKILQQAMDAASEIVRRGVGEGIDAQMADAASLLIPFFLDRLGQKPAAASGFLDYVEKHKLDNRANATLALDNAQALIGQLRADPMMRENADVTRAYERFLPLAIAAPFDRKEFAFEYAQRLQLNGKPAEAIAYFHQVPADDKRALNARFLELVAIKQELDDAPSNAPARAVMLADIQRLADEVNKAATAALAQSPSADQQTAARSMLVRTSLLAADLARREQKDPQRAIRLLQDFEGAVQGLPNADSLLNEAMYVRVQSYMAAEQYTQATQELVKLLNKTQGAQGAQIVYNLLQKLNADFDRAAADNDRPAMRSLAKNRAQLSGFLVNWAAENKDPNIKRYTYRYRVFDAETQRRAAELEEDPQARRQGLQTALQRYQALESEENRALYRAALDAGSSDTAAYDPQVTLGIALINYDLGNFEAAADGLSTLLNARRLGTPLMTVIDNGQERVIDNDQYWEALLKLIRSSEKLNRNLEEARSYLKLQYITWGPHVGGKKWKSEFEQVRQQLIPDFDVSDLTVSPSTTAPATAPQ